MTQKPRSAPPAAVLVASGAVSVQFGAALATKLFKSVGPGGAVALRIGVAAIVLAAFARPSVRKARQGDLAAAVAFGLILAAMNLAFYESISRIPLGVAVTIEFSGPLALALVGSRRLLDLIWAAMAGGGVALFTTTSGARHVDSLGIVLAFAAGACWIGYILLSKRVGGLFPAQDGLAIAMVIGAAVLLPVGLATAGTHMFHPRALGLGAAVAVLSSVLPYSFEFIALRNVSPRTFSVLLSIDPGVAAIAGLAVLGQHLTSIEVAGLALVSAANVGNALTGRSDVVATTP